MIELWTTGWAVDNPGLGTPECRCRAVAWFEGAGGHGRYVSCDRDDSISVDDSTAVLAKQFGADMRRGVAELSDLGYDATYFRRMLGDHGPVEAARRLVLDPVPSYGLWRLKELGRLDTSVEMWVLLPWYVARELAGLVRKRAGRRLSAPPGLA